MIKKNDNYLEIENVTTVYIDEEELIMNSNNEENKKRAYVYTRVSTLMQVEGKSLEGQLKEIELYCKGCGIEIVNVYSDEGKSGKSISGRPAFQRMLKDIVEKEEVDYVIVWKLSRFGRNAKDTLESLEILQKHGAQLIAKEEGLNSGSTMGKLIITILSSVAEMERENIIEQTKNGKKYNALDGNWNGGAAPYGYNLVDKKLVENKEEAEVVRKIFDWFVNTDLGYNGITARLNDEHIPPRQTQRLDRKAMQENDTEEKIYLPVVEDWYATMVRKILDCPVYCGKIRWGYENVVKKDGKEKRVKNNEVILVEGKHDPIITEELWNRAQEKRKETGVAFGRPDSNSEFIRNTFNGIAKCPNCGSGMIAHKESYKKNNGEVSVYYKYICGYYNNHKHGKCKKNAIKADYLEGVVLDKIHEYIKRPNVSDEITKHLGNQLDTGEIDKEIDKAREKLKELADSEEKQYDVLSKIGIGKFKNIKLEKIEENLGNINESRKEVEDYINRKQQEIEAIEQDRLNIQTIKYIIENFDTAYKCASKEQQKRLIQSMVKEVKLGYFEGTDKVIPVSMVLKITGEQIELLSKEKEENGNFDNLELSKMNDECCVLLQRVDGKIK